MSKHRAERPRELRANYGRILAAGFAAVVTTVALLGGVGVIPVRGSADTASSGGAAGLNRAADAAGSTRPRAGRSTPSPSVPASPTPSATGTAKRKAPPAEATELSTSAVAVPAASGSGRRVVFSQEHQRVWLVADSGAVVDTYLVSGSLTDNLSPGSYEVYSRSRWAVGIDDSGVMQYFVRFTRGNNAAIGFHSIPTKHGQPLQTLRQLGTPQSHGCIRQKLADAKRMWSFADVGTDVVVV